VKSKKVKAKPRTTSFILKIKDCHNERKEERYLHSIAEEQVEIQPG